MTSTPENFGHTANPTTHLFTSAPDPTIHPPSPNKFFDSAISPYAEALKKAEHSPCTQRLHQTTRNITWFSPSYNMVVKTNIGEKFFYLINKHFLPNNRLLKICHKFNVKLIYSCMPNMACIIKSYNNKLRYLITKIDEMLCNCRTKSECPLNGKCRTQINHL